MVWSMSSPAFREGETIPRRHTCEGEDVSPPLVWNEPPPATRSLVLIADDPDAPMGTWVHWVLYNLPAELRDLPEGIPAQERLSNGALHGLTDFERVGYGGPCPPPGKPHRYFFRLYALDRQLGLKARATKAQVLDACRGHILAEAQLMGLYARDTHRSGGRR